MSLFPDSPAFLGEKVVGENHVTVIKAEAVRLGNTLEFFNEGRGISSIRPHSLFYLRAFA